MALSEYSIDSSRAREFSARYAPSVNPLSAPSQPDPYPYYESLLRRGMPWFDRELGMWIVARAAHVDYVLSHEAARVRPAGEPVPAGIRNSRAGDLFGAFARMTDGARHAALRELVETRLLELVLQAPAPSTSAEDLNAYIERSAIDSIARAFGFARRDIPELLNAVRAFARGASASGDTARLAVSAGNDLFEHFAARFANETLEQLASRVSLLFQAYDATRALTGNALARLATETNRDVDAAIAGTMQTNPPVHNTRRYLAADLTVDGTFMREGSAILVILAAATIDAGRPYGFGSGPHACPGSLHARTIAASTLRNILDGGCDASRLTVSGYAASPNCRIPLIREAAA